MIPLYAIGWVVLNVLIYVFVSLIPPSWAAVTLSEKDIVTLKNMIRSGQVGGPVGLDANFAVVSSITGATSSTPLRVGDNSSATTDVCIYTDATLGGLVKPCTDTNTRTYIWTNKTHCLYDVEGSSCMETFDPDAATTLAMYQYTAGYRAVWRRPGASSAHRSCRRAAGRVPAPAAASRH